MMIYDAWDIKSNCLATYSVPKITYDIKTYDTYMM